MITTKEIVEWLDNLAKDALYQPFDYTPNDGARFAAIRDFITAHSWQDISTAPRDGKQIIVVGGSYSCDTQLHGFSCEYPMAVIYSAAINPDVDPPWFGCENIRIKNPTYWMPLPAAPQPPEGT